MIIRMIMMKMIVWHCYFMNMFETVRLRAFFFTKSYKDKNIFCNIMLLPHFILTNQ